MMRFLLIFCILLASIWIGLHWPDDPGYVLIALNHWTLETTVWVASGLLLAAFLILSMTFKFLKGLFHAPRAWRAWLTRRRLARAQAKTERGLLEFNEGYWLKAKTHLMKALPDTKMPLLNYLTAARAAQEMGDTTLRDHYLREAQHSVPEASIAIALTRAQLQLADEQWEQALATLQHLHERAPKHPYVLKLLKQCYEGMGDAAQMIQLLPALKKYQVMSADDYTALEARAYQQQMEHLIHEQDAIGLETFFNTLPSTLRNNPTLTALYCRYLIQQQKSTDAEAMLKRSLQKGFQDDLITLYGELPLPPADLRFAESLQKKQPHAAALFLCLGRLSKRSQLWGKAKTYFEKSLQLNPAPITWMELAELLTFMKEQDAATEAYREGLTLCLKQSEP